MSLESVDLIFLQTFEAIIFTVFFQPLLLRMLLQLTVTDIFKLSLLSGFFLLL